MPLTSSTPNVSCLPLAFATLALLSIPGCDDSASPDSPMDTAADEDTDDGSSDPGNDAPGNDDPGNDDPGNDDPGNDDPGNDDPGRCVEVSLSQLDTGNEFSSVAFAAGFFAVYTHNLDFGLGDGTEDTLLFEFYGASSGPYDLSESYADCGTCLTMYQDGGVAEDVPPTADAIFFQSEGTAEITLADDGSIQTAELSGVTLVEMTGEPSSSESVPVEGGTCVRLADGVYTMEPPAP